MKYKRHSPKRRYPQGYRAEGEAFKQKVLDNEFEAEKEELLKGEKAQGNTIANSRKKWRKQYQCKMVKGDHEFELVKPRYSSYQNENRDLSVADFYAIEREKRGERVGYFSKVLYYYECVHCRKQEVAWENDKLPNKKIRKIIGESYNG